MNKALFEVGEEAIFIGEGSGRPRRSVIANREWDESRVYNLSGPHTGWSYQRMESVETNKWTREVNMRKLPPPADCTYDELIKQLNTETELQYEKERSYE